MTGLRRGWVLVALVGLIAALGIAVQVLGTNSPPATAQAATQPCFSCDARHAHLHAAPIHALEAQQ
jgi:hypothetical protein